MTDAAHMLSDLAGFLISLCAIWIGSRPPSKKMSYGWHRAGETVIIRPHLDSFARLHMTVDSITKLCDDHYCHNGTCRGDWCNNLSANRVDVDWCPVLRSNSARDQS